MLVSPEAELQSTEQGRGGVVECQVESKADVYYMHDLHHDRRKCRSNLHIDIKEIASATQALHSSERRPLRNGFGEGESQGGAGVDR